MIDKEEEIVVLYALYRCGGKGRKSRIIKYILDNGLLKPREGDTERRQTGETKIENDLAWARENLKRKEWLAMPEHGFWQITKTGGEMILRIAKNAHLQKNDLDESKCARFNAKFFDELEELERQIEARTGLT